MTERISAPRFFFLPPPPCLSVPLSPPSCVEGRSLTSEQAARPSALLFSCCPTVSPPERSADGTLQKRIARLVILGFSLGMVMSFIADSRLCASLTRHAQVSRLKAACLRSTWQGGGNPLRCILPHAAVNGGSGNPRFPHLPGSTPVGFSSSAVRP